MDREHIKGAADKVKGTVKDTAGKVTGDEKMQAEGRMDKAKGAAHNTVGDAKETARDAAR
ncbi:MAG: CsbD family protein [Pseudolabrys sp.]